MRRSAAPSSHVCRRRVTRCSAKIAVSVILGAPTGFLGQQDANKCDWRCPICTLDCCCVRGTCMRDHMHCKRYRRMVVKGKGNKAANNSAAVSLSGDRVTGADGVNGIGEGALKNNKRKSRGGQHGKGVEGASRAHKLVHMAGHQPAQQRAPSPTLAFGDHMGQQAHGFNLPTPSGNMPTPGNPWSSVMPFTPMSMVGTPGGGASNSGHAALRRCDTVSRNATRLRRAGRWDTLHGRAAEGLHAWSSQLLVVRYSLWWRNKPGCPWHAATSVSAPCHDGTGAGSDALGAGGRARRQGHTAAHGDARAQDEPWRGRARECWPPGWAPRCARAHAREYGHLRRYALGPVPCSCRACGCAPQEAFLGLV